MAKMIAAGGVAILALIILISANVIIQAVAAVAMPAAVAIALSVTLATAAAAWFAVQAVREWAGSWAARRKMAEMDARYRLSEALVNEAQAHKTRRESDVFVTVAKRDEQVFRTVGDVTIPLHLAPGRVNGRVAIEAGDIQRWAAWQHLNASKTPQIATEAMPAPAVASEPDPVLPILDVAQRLLIVGASDSGKSTLLKHLIQARLDNSKVIIIDPHSPSKVLGVDVIGAGRDYAAVEAALESLLYLMTSRYSDIADGARFADFERVTVLIDEWTGISQNVETAGDMLAQLLVESRKARIHFVVASHSDDVTTMGLKGRGKLRQSFTICRLFGGNGQARRAFLDPTHKVGPDGRRQEPTEYRLPGPFDGHPTVPAAQLVLDLPPAPTSEELQIIELLQTGASNYAICQALGWKRGGAAYERIDATKQRFMDVQNAF